MKIWAFKVFLKDKTTNVIEEWLEGLPTKAQVKIDERINYLAITPQWVRPYFDILHGYEGIHEIRVILQNIQYRLLGCFGPREKEFTLLIGSKEIGSKFNPASAPTIAQQRRKLILEDGSYTDDFI